MTTFRQMGQFKELLDRRGFTASWRGELLVIDTPDNRITFAGERARAIAAAHAWVLREHPRRPGAPKGNRNARRENRRAA